MNLFSSRKWPTASILAMALIGLAACASLSASVAVSSQPPPTPLSEQFDVISKDGVEIAFPKYWHSDPQADLVYCVSRSDTIRITVAVLSALPQSYYDGLVAQRAVTKTTVHGYSTYMNEYAYPYEGHQLTTKCITVVQGDEACHIMILCDTSVLGAFEPTFQYVLNSLKFIPGERAG